MSKMKRIAFFPSMREYYFIGDRVKEYSCRCLFDWDLEMGEIHKARSVRYVGVMKDQLTEDKIPTQQQVDEIYYGKAG